MKLNFIENLKRTPKKIYLYSALAVFLAIITFFILNYFQFYVHEGGHASSAILTTMMTHNQSVTINFTYIPYKIPYTNVSFLVPQQTITRLPNVMLSYGVLFTIIFYALIFTFIIYIISKIEGLKNNNRIAYSILAVLGLLIMNDIVSNLFCGTDGFNLSCSNSFLMIFSGVFLFLLLVVLGYFYLELFLFRSNIFNYLNKKEVIK